MAHSGRQQETLDRTPEDRIKFISIMKENNRLKYSLFSLLLATMAFAGACAAPMPPAEPAAPPPTGQLILSGDLSWFRGLGMPGNCVLKSRYAPGDPVGFRMTAVDGLTGELVTSAELVVHLSYGGGTVDIPMLYRGVPQGNMPIHADMWTAKWVVPDDAPVGNVLYSVTATDSTGRTGEWRPFENELSHLTIGE